MPRSYSRNIRSTHKKDTPYSVFPLECRCKFHITVQSSQTCMYVMNGGFVETNVIHWFPALLWFLWIVSILTTRVWNCLVNIFCPLECRFIKLHRVREQEKPKNHACKHVHVRDGQCNCSHIFQLISSAYVWMYHRMQMHAP